jgi:hypothetical protein
MPAKRSMPLQERVRLFSLNRLAHSAGKLRGSAAGFPRRQQQETLRWMKLCVTDSRIASIHTETGSGTSFAKLCWKHETCDADSINGASVKYVAGAKLIAATRQPQCFIKDADSTTSTKNYLIITETQSYDACGRNGECGARKQGHAVNTTLYARRQLGPGQPLDRFPVSPSPCCRRSLFAGPTPAARCRVSPSWLSFSDNQ